MKTNLLKKLTTLSIITLSTLTTILPTTLNASEVDKYINIKNSNECVQYRHNIETYKSTHNGQISEYMISALDDTRDGRCKDVDQNIRNAQRYERDVAQTRVRENNTRVQFARHTNNTRWDKKVETAWKGRGVWAHTERVNKYNFAHDNFHTRYVWTDKHGVNHQFVGSYKTKMRLGLEYINVKRAQHHLRPLKWDSRLWKFSREQVRTGNHTWRIHSYGYVELWSGRGDGNILQGLHDLYHEVNNVSAPWAHTRTILNPHVSRISIYYNKHGMAFDLF